MPLAHQRNLRKGRHSEGGQIYLVTTVTRARVPLFKDLRNARIVVNAMKWCDEQSRTETWAFVVMPDHLHWLFALSGEQTLDQVMNSVKKYVSRRISCARRVWQRGYHDHALRKEEDLKETARYVVMNPVRAGLVRSARQYPHWDGRWL